MSQYILIVDNDPVIRTMLAEVLVEEGYRVATAENGVEGLAIIEQALPAIVLLDMRMPVLDGWGFAQALKARELKLPIVLMTAAQDAAHWAQEIEAEKVLAKPFNLEELLEELEHRIQKQP